MEGSQTRTFTEMTCFHQQKRGTGTDSPLIASFRYGVKAYYVGGHPVWERLRGVYEMREAPFVLGGLFFIAGFLKGYITWMPRPMSDELMAFHRGEQMSRLRKVFRRTRLVGSTLGQPP